MADTKPATTIRHRAYGASALALLALLFLGLVILANYALRGLRADLTENDLYTLAPGTREIVKNLSEPINLYFFFSHAAGEQAPYLKIYANRVRELLEELQARSAGKIRLRAIDPEPFSEDEDRASEFGLAAIPLGASGDTMYFGLAGTNSTDGRAVIELFHPDKEEFLEYDVARLINQLATPKKPVVGLLTSLPMSSDFNPMTGQMREPWAIVSQLDQLVTMRTLSPDLTSIDADVDVLMLVHPKKLSPAALYAIDQFVMRGGRALIFVDPQSEADASGQDPGNPLAGMGMDRSSSLEPLLSAWGIDFASNQVVGDPHYALTVTMRMGEQPVRHIGILGFDRSSLAPKDVITAALDNINVATAGYLKPRAGSNVTFEPLIQSSTEAGLLPLERFAMLTDASTLRDGFRATGERYTIAARVTGKLKSAFPNGKPQDAEKPATPLPQAAVLKETTKPANLVVVADSDLLTDQLWVRNQSFFGQRFAQAWASNGDLVANAVDNLTGSSPLISIRGRASFVRPFDTVEALRRSADDRFRIKEQELEEQLRATEQKLSELQSRRNDQSSLILSPEQEQELDQFQQKKVQIRKELREVRHGLAQEIDRLGTVLKIINIGLVPLAVALLGIAAALWRRRRVARPA
jgi:ABC-type uncharacterized transport system involved in gliding motility auxiliary subunit